jgi:hypothetical protein
MSHCFRCEKPMASMDKFELSRPTEFGTTGGWDFCTLECLKIILAREDHEVIFSGNSEHRCETCNARLPAHPFNPKCLPTPCVQIARFQPGQNNEYHSFCSDRCALAWIG